MLRRLRRRPAPVVLTVLAGIVLLGLLLFTTSATSERRELALPQTVLVAPGVTTAELRGHTTIVHYWASWCEPCKREAPEIAALPRRLEGRARLIGVDWSDAHRRGLAFARRHDWLFPNLEDPRGTSGRQNGLQGLPTTFIVGPDGRIVRTLIGPQTVDGLLAQLD